MQKINLYTVNLIKIEAISFVFINLNFNLSFFNLLNFIISCLPTVNKLIIIIITIASLIIFLIIVYIIHANLITYFQ